VAVRAGGGSHLPLKPNKEDVREQETKSQAKTTRPFEDGWLEAIEDKARGQRAPIFLKQALLARALLLASKRDPDLLADLRSAFERGLI